METEQFTDSSSEKKGGIQKGDSFFRTNNTELAVALLTLGVKPFKSNPIVKEYKDGKETVFFNLETHTPDKSISCMECLTNWKKGAEYIAANQDEPFAISMATLINRKSFLETIKKKKPIMTYKLGEDGPTVWVTKGTKRQIALEKKYGNKKS